MIGLIVLGIMVALIVIVTLVRQANYIIRLEEKNKILLRENADLEEDNEDLRLDNEGLEKENEELKELKSQEAHNNTIIVEKDKEIFSLISEIENIINGKRTAEEKENKIKDLLSNR